VFRGIPDPPCQRHVFLADVRFRYYPCVPERAEAPWERMLRCR